MLTWISRMWTQLCCRLTWIILHVGCRKFVFVISYMHSDHLIFFRRSLACEGRRRGDPNALIWRYVDHHCQWMLIYARGSEPLGSKVFFMLPSECCFIERDLNSLLPVLFEWSLTSQPSHFQTFGNIHNFSFNSLASISIYDVLYTNISTSLLDTPAFPMFGCRKILTACPIALAQGTQPGSDMVERQRKDAKNQCLYFVRESQTTTSRQEGKISGNLDQSQDWQLAVDWEK